MVRVKMFVVPTAEAAERLIQHFSRAGIAARALAPDLLLDEKGVPLFQHRRAAVICQISDDQPEPRIDAAYRGSGIEAIVLERTLESTPDHPTRRLIVVYRSNDAVQANLMRNTLENFGVPALVNGDFLHGETLGMGGAAGSSLVLVAEEQQAAAREIVRAVEVENSRKLLPIVNLNELEGDDDYEAPDEPLPAATDWPTCPKCDKRRVTMCPICDTVGNDFPLADANYAAMAEEDETPPFAAICTMCDEPWEPKFFRRCEWCGHDFGHGLVLSQTLPKLREPTPLNSRIIAVLVGLVGTVALMTAYFALLART